MFINLSNHPSANWSREQTDAALQYGEVQDVPFANVDPGMDEEEMRKLAALTLEKVLAFKPDAVMCQGEYTLTYAVINGLQRHGIKCLAACTRRVAAETVQADGSISKESVFKFERFREYITIDT